MTVCYQKSLLPCTVCLPEFISMVLLSSSSSSSLSSSSSPASSPASSLLSPNVANELLDIQLGISQLKDPTNPEQVVEYLAGLRTVQYTQMVAVVRDTLPVTLLEAGDELGCEVGMTRTQNKA